MLTARLVCLPVISPSPSHLLTNLQLLNNDTLKIAEIRAILTTSSELGLRKLLILPSRASLPTLVLLSSGLGSLVTYMPFL